MARGLCKKGKGRYANFIRKGIASMRTGAILNMRVKVVVKDPETSMAKEKGLEKEKAKAKEKVKGGKGKGKGGRAQHNSSMIVKKKSRFQEDGEGSSSIMVGKSQGRDKDEEGQAENDLYRCRLMRGGGYDTEDEEDEVNDDLGEEEIVLEPEIEQANPPSGQVSATPEWGSSSSAPEWGSGSVPSHSSSSASQPVKSEEGSG
jgi:hypothetical protein